MKLLKNMKKAKKRNKFILFLYIVLLLAQLVASGYLIYSISLLNNIENLLRYVAIGVLVVIDLIFISSCFRVLAKNKKLGYIFFILLAIVVGFGEYKVASYIHRAYSSISKLNKDEIKYASYIVTMSNSDLADIKDLKKQKIGMTTDKNSIEGYTLGNEIIKENNLKENNTIEEYDTYTTMAADLYNGELDAAIMPSGYVSMLQSTDGMESIQDDTKVIYTKEKIMKKEKNKSSGKQITKPFTLLVMGVDSEKDDINSVSSFNGDSIMLVTFNPKTLNSTILSIPRDTYVPIACFKNKKKNKITHAAWNGESCMIDTIEDLTGIPIDYYIKINFKGVVGLVDSLGGIDVNVPMSFCEQNSDRKWDDDTICLLPGEQHLNGEQALALSRHRKTINDFIRGQNQQLVMQGMIESAKNINDIETIYSILDTVQKNMDTNITTDEILSLYNIAKTIMDKSSSSVDGKLIEMQRLYLSGHDQMIYDPDLKMTLYNYIYYKDSLDEIVKAMKVNLGLEKETVVKEFSYSLKEPYTQPVIGKDGKYKDSSYSKFDSDTSDSNSSSSKSGTMPNFVGQTKASVLSWANKNNISVSFNTVASTEAAGTIITQSVWGGTSLSKVTTVVFSVSDGSKKSNSSSGSSSSGSGSGGSSSSGSDNTGGSGSGSGSGGSGSDSGSGGSGGNTGGEDGGSGGSGGGSGTTDPTEDLKPQP